MNTKSLLVAAMLAIMLVGIVVSGCVTTSPAAPPAASTAASAATAAGGAGPSGPPKVSTSEASTTISGSTGGDVKATMAKGGYLIAVKSADGNVQMTALNLPLIPYSAAALGSSGQYEQSLVTEWYSDGEMTFTITASKPYTITMTKLPEGTPASPPQTYAGKGQKALGPIALKAGTATIKISCPDAKQAGFTVDLKDGTDGSRAASVASNVESGTAQNNYEAQKTVNVPAGGNYYVEVVANRDAGWQIDISQ